MLLITLVQIKKEDKISWHIKYFYKLFYVLRTLSQKYLPAMQNPGYFPGKENQNE